MLTICQSAWLVNGDVKSRGVVAAGCDKEHNENEQHTSQPPSDDIIARHLRTLGEGRNSSWPPEMEGTVERRRGNTLYPQTNTAIS